MERKGPPLPRTGGGGSGRRGSWPWPAHPTRLGLLGERSSAGWQGAAGGLGGALGSGCGEPRRKRLGAGGARAGGGLPERVGPRWETSRGDRPGSAGPPPPTARTAHPAGRSRGEVCLLSGRPRARAPLRPPADVPRRRRSRYFRHRLPGDLNGQTCRTPREGVTPGPEGERRLGGLGQVTGLPGRSPGTMSCLGRPIFLRVGDELGGFYSGCILEREGEDLGVPEEGGREPTCYVLRR